MDNRKKPIKESEMKTTYIAGIIAMLISVVCWFLPTMQAEYRAKDVMGSIGGEVLYGSHTENVAITFFSFNEDLPFLTNIINILLLVLSIVSIVIAVIPLIKKEVMKPNAGMAVPSAGYILYLVIFCIRLLNAMSDIQYDISISPVLIIYGLSLIIAFTCSLTVFIYRSRLKSQQEAENNPAVMG